MQHQHTEREIELLAKLKQFDSQSVPFFDAKQKLISEGYTEQEVARATYSFSYDGVPDTPKKPDVLNAYFTQNPEEADKIAKFLVDNQKATDLTRKAAYFAAARYAPGLHARSYYELKWADEVDYPFFTALFSIPLAFMAVINLGLPKEYIYGGPALVTAYWLVKKYIFRA